MAACNLAEALGLFGDGGLAAVKFQEQGGGDGEAEPRIGVAGGDLRGKTPRERGFPLF